MVSWSCFPMSIIYVSAVTASKYRIGQWRCGLLAYRQAWSVHTCYERHRSQSGRKSCSYIHKRLLVKHLASHKREGNSQHIFVGSTALLSNWKVGLSPWLMSLYLLTRPDKRRTSICPALLRAVIRMKLLRSELDVINSTYKTRATRGKEMPAEFCYSRQTYGQTSRFS